MADDAPDVRVKVKDTGAHITITRELFETAKGWETNPYTELKGDPYGSDGATAPFEFPADTTAATPATASKKES